MEFSLHFSLHAPKFWKRLFPTYRDGYRDGLAAGSRAAGLLVEVNRHPMFLTDEDQYVVTGFVGEGSRLPQ